MLAEERKTPPQRKRSRRPSPEEPSATRVIEAVPAPTEERDHATDQNLALAPIRRRPNASTARPLSQQDRNMIETAEWMMNVMPILDREPNDLAELAVVETPGPLTPVDEAPARPLIVGGDSTSKMVAMRVGPPPRKKRHWVSGAIILTLIAAVLLTAIATITPLASGKSEGLAVHAAGPLGLPIALDAANQPPSGQWVAMIGAQPNQDVGGGAGPGVQAPGSAGLPVSSVQTIVNTGAPSAQAAGAVSSAPLSPWPPSNAYAAVPGYGAYAMNDVGGYYYWAFGQCTWWAQYERKDENLMHMGNAQYWASVAASRGYHVSWTPRVGATVVFQPGVQGAGGAGHVAHVVKVYPDNWFLVSEMNFYWNGGGWGRVDYRFAHAGGGVQFIY
jgi:surface antigen